MAKLSRVLIAVPVFEGADVLRETLASILNQDFDRFRVLISVDGGDHNSYAECQRHVSDSRCQLVLHSSRLGWAGNINWIASQLREEFFCYWQQDDICDPSYLRNLYKHAIRHPEASAVYSDMEYFGGNKEGIVEYPSVTGFALERVLHQITKNNPMPHRGMVRAEALRAALPISQPGPWVVTLAREGELHRIPKRLYRKRVRAASLSAKLHEASSDELRARTLDWGLGNLKAALPIVRRAERTRLLTYLAHQLINKRPCRGYHWVAREAGPGEPLRFIADFLRAARNDHGAYAFSELASDSDFKSILTERLALLRKDSIECLMINAVLNDLPDSRPPEQSASRREAPRASIPERRTVLGRLAGRLLGS